MGGRHLAVPHHPLERFPEVDRGTTGFPLQAREGVGAALGGVTCGQSEAPPVLDGERVAGLCRGSGLADHVVEE